ncbi:MAG: enoyl-CoA hydratase [Planctomycetia bacterium]|nr:enoyl-CoA hydratase [Planctomycetia bacterium]
MSTKAADSEPILVAPHVVEGGTILEITINRPEVHNAINGAAARLLLEAWRLFRDDDALTVAVITVSQGYTYAGGLELFCHGHIRLAEPQATFSVACRRWGVPLVDGGTVYLPRLVGWGAALPLIITGQRISAERAHQVSLVWELAPKGGGLDRAMSMARQICQQPRDAMLADLYSALHGSHLPLDSALELEAANMAPVMQSESTRRGVEAFQKGKRFWFT